MARWSYHPSRRCNRRQTMTTTKHHCHIWTPSRPLLWFHNNTNNNSDDSILSQHKSNDNNNTMRQRAVVGNNNTTTTTTTPRHSFSTGLFKSLWTAVLLFGLLHTVFILPATFGSGNQFYHYYSSYYVFYLPYSPPQQQQQETRHLRRHEPKGEVVLTTTTTTNDFPRVVSLEYFFESSVVRTTSLSSSAVAEAGEQISFPLGPLGSILKTDEDEDDSSAELDDANDDPTRFYSVRDSSDLPGMERRKFPRHEIDPHCKPMSAWQRQSFPVCNELHAADMQSSLFHAEMSLLSSQGSWRLAWRKDEQHLNNNSTIVWKTFRYEKPMEEAFFEFNRVDALAMERLTASPHVVNLYGFCGLSVVTEFAGKALDAVAGKMNSTDRLRLARQVAQGLADIHSLDERPSLVHNDINLANLVFTQDDRPVLNDFNVASLLMKHNETGETCPFVNRFPNAQWKSPEEQVLDHVKEERPVVTEKIDIYALGNIFYRLAVGWSPWKKPGSLRMTLQEKEQVARAKRFNGTLPEVPKAIQNSSDSAIVALLDITRQCYRFQPTERPTAQSIVTFLTKALDQIEQHDQHSNTIKVDSSSSNNITDGYIDKKSI